MVLHEKTKGDKLYAREVNEIVRHVRGWNDKRERALRPMDIPPELRLAVNTSGESIKRGYVVDLYSRYRTAAANKEILLARQVLYSGRSRIGIAVDDYAKDNELILVAVSGFWPVRASAMPGQPYRYGAKEESWEAQPDEFGPLIGMEGHDYGYGTYWENGVRWAPVYITRKRGAAQEVLHPSGARADTAEVIEFDGSVDVRYWANEPFGNAFIKISPSA